MLFDPVDLPAALAKSLRYCNLPRGEALFRQGDPATAIFAVQAGRVRLVRHGRDGGTVTLHVAGPGESFAEAALYSDTYHCDAVADVDSVAIAIPKPPLHAALATDPLLAGQFMARLARQVRDLRAHLELRNIRSARERVIAWLLLTGAEDGVELDRPLKDIAGEIGLSHESFYRTLAALQADGLVQRNGNSIRLNYSETV